MNITELHKFLEQWRRLRSFPSPNGWPDKLSLSSGVWRKFLEIQSYTKGDGYEYAASIFYINGEILVTPYSRGTRENVVTRDAVQVRYEPKDKNYFEKKFFSNGKLVKKETIPTDKVPKQIDIVYLFNVHTHPVQRDTYSFFSGTDIRSFLGSDAIVMGVLTDRLWLVCKTNRSLKQLGENGEDMLLEVSRRIFDGEKNIDSLIDTLLSGWGLVFYGAENGESLKKIR